jgi:hypothetical protein
MSIKRGRKRSLLLPSILAILLVLAVVLFLSMQKDTSVTNYALKGNVTDLRVNDSKIIVGVSNDPNELNFGMVVVNMTVQKFIDLRNTESNEAFVEISKVGNISSFVNVDSESFILGSGENHTVSVTFNGTQKGYYNGELTVTVETPKYLILSPLSLWR